MNRNQLYKEVLVIVLLGFITNLNAIVHKPSGNEEKIKLEIRGKERIYYELDDDNLIYKNIGKQFNSGDSIQVGIYSRTIKAPTGKKKRNYGFKVQINDKAPFELKYKKEGSRVTSPDRPGWNYTQSGKWYIYLPVKGGNYTIKITSLKGNPVVYVRLSSNLIKKDGSYGEIIHTVNRQDRTEIITAGKQKPTKWYTLKGLNQQQFEIKGPAKVRAFSRLRFNDESLTDNYYIFVREDGIDLGSYFFQTEKSIESSVRDSKDSVGKWRSLWINIPDGKHYYTFSLARMEENQDKTVFIRLKEWKNE